MWSCSCFCTNMLQFFGDNKIMIFLLRTNVQLVKFVGIVQIFTFFQICKTDYQIHVGLELPSEKCHKNFCQHKINNPGDHGVKSLPMVIFLWETS